LAKRSLTFSKLELELEQRDGLSSLIFWDDRRRERGTVELVWMAVAGRHRIEDWQIERDQKAISTYQQMRYQNSIFCRTATKQCG
jgi:hypothetical protein